MSTVGAQRIVDGGERVAAIEETVGETTAVVIIADDLA
jgi:hypothetical protein